MARTTNAEDPNAIEKGLRKVEKRDTTLVNSVDNEIKGLEKKLTKLTKSSTKNDKKLTKATAYESKTAKKASAANITHEKAAINLRSITDQAQLTKKDRDTTAQMLESKRKELETATVTKRHHDEQAALKRSELTKSTTSGTNP